MEPAPVTDDVGVPQAQEDRIRLAREYLRRVAYNAELIQLWVMKEYDLSKARNAQPTPFLWNGKRDLRLDGF